MCRYGMTTYKQHYACFDCRKTFKRRLLTDVGAGRPQSVAGQWFKDNLGRRPQPAINQEHAKEPNPAKCPDCGGLMASMGLDFEAPPKTDRVAWQHLRHLYAAGIAFHSCGCGGPGLVPATTEALVAHLERQLPGYVQHLRYWLTRAEPVTKADHEADRLQNWSHNWQLAKNAKGRVDAPAALAYWQARVQTLEAHIAQAKRQLPASVRA